jgi:hypothetical protein
MTYIFSMASEGKLGVWTVMTNLSIIGYPE